MGTTYTRDEKAFLVQIGNRIREFRSEADLSQEKLAFESVSSPYFSAGVLEFSNVDFFSSTALPFCCSA